MSQRRSPSLWQRTDQLQAVLLTRSLQRVTVAMVAERPVEEVRIEVAVAELVATYHARGKRTGQGVVAAVAETLGQPPERVWSDVMRGLRRGRQR